MSSIYCPQCSYEIPVHDSTGEPILEEHAKYCHAKSPGKERDRLLKVILQNKMRMGLIPYPKKEKKP